MAEQKASRPKTSYSAENQEAAEPTLTTRENEVLHWAAQGKRNEEIAQIVHASPHTIEKHFENIFGKLDVETRDAAIHNYYELIIAERDRRIAELERQLAERDQPHPPG